MIKWFFFQICFKYGPSSTHPKWKNWCNSQKIYYYQNSISPGPWAIFTKLGTKYTFVTGVIQSVELRAMAFLYGEKSQLHNIIVFSFEFDFLTQDTSIPRELTWSCSILGLLLLGWAMLSTGFLSSKVQIFLQKTSIMRNIYYTKWWQRSRSGRGNQQFSPSPFYSLVQVS